MIKSRGFRGLRAGAVAVFGVSIISGCISTIPLVQEASATGGDFSLLTCDQLRDAELTLGQQLAFVNAVIPPLFAATTAQGVELSEQRVFVQTAQSDIAAKAGSSGCAASNPVVTASQALQQTDGLSDATPLAAGQYLQVGTFASVANAETATQRFQTAGLPVVREVVALSGRSYSRVLVGPLATREMLRQADAIATEIGLRDSFFVTR